ncbi:MAG: hypothetical protein K5648_05785 [Erysipelotrichaceae bacterium]|nr:hypothetical protein [Erysipelotrichaceae bacterium]
MKSKWVSLARILILIFLMILYMNAYALFTEIRKDVLYSSRSYGLDTLNQDFDNGEYEKLYMRAIANRYADDELSVDVSQYEAFGFYYHYFTLAKSHPEDKSYRDAMAAEKEKITWKKILDVITLLENELDQ